MGDVFTESGENVDQVNSNTFSNVNDATVSGGDSFVLSLDVGTTTIRAHVYNQKVEIRGTGSRKVCCFLDFLQDFIVFLCFMINIA